jgi:hypothetical protein
MNDSTADQGGIAGLMAMTTAFTIGLHLLGGVPEFAIDWHSPLPWIGSSDFADVIAALLRYVGLVSGYWVLITTSLYYLITRVRRERRPRWLNLVTLPPIRRAIDRALAASLAISIVATPVGPLRADEPALPVTPPIVFEVASDGIPVPHVGRVGPDQTQDEPDLPVADTTPGPPEPSLQEPNSSTDVAVQPAPITNPPVTVVTAATSTTEATYTVERGDNLWTISASYLRNSINSEPTIAEIDGYWRAVIEANRDTLRSGDPNLIYPGELVTLPAPEVSP